MAWVSQQESLSKYGTPAYTGWDPVSADADFRAKGGNNGGNNNSDVNYPTVSVPDINALTEKAFQASKPYYEQLIKESRGDFNRAKDILHEDYARGIRQAREDNARQVAYANEDARQAFNKLGIQIPQEQENLLDNLNQRGMAVGQMSPEGQFNVLGKTGFNQNADDTFSPTNVNMNVGRGSVELSRLANDQALRQEAVQRTKTRAINESGINLQRYTNVPEGKNITDNTIDRSKLGSADLSYLRGTEDLTRSQQVKEQNLATQRANEALGTATSVANSGLNSIPTALTNRYLRNTATDFVNEGI